MGTNYCRQKLISVMSSMSVMPLVISERRRRRCARLQEVQQSSLKMHWFRGLGGNLGLCCAGMHAAIKQAWSLHVWIPASVPINVVRNMWTCVSVGKIELCGSSSTDFVGLLRSVVHAPWCWLPSVHSPFQQHVPVWSCNSGRGSIVAYSFIQSLLLRNECCM